MKTLQVNVFGDEEKKMIKDMQIIGMPRRAANVLTYLMRSPTGTVKQICAASGLRQPEVSLGAKDLSTWLESELVPTGARNSIVYALKVPAANVFAYYHQIKLDEMNKVTTALDNLGALDASIQAIQNPGA